MIRSKVLIFYGEVENMSGERMIQNGQKSLDKGVPQPIDLSELSERVSKGEMITGMIAEIPHLSARQIRAAITRPPGHRKALPISIAEREANIMLTASLAGAINRSLGIAGNALTIWDAFEERRCSLDRPMGPTDYFMGSTVGVSRVLLDSVISETIKAALVEGAGFHPILAISIAAVSTPRIHEAVWKPVSRELINFYKEHEARERDILEGIKRSFRVPSKDLTVLPLIQSSHKDQVLVPAISPTQAISSVPAPMVTKSQDRDLSSGDNHSANDLLHANLNPGGVAQLAVRPRDPRPVLDTGKLLSSVPQMQERAYNRAAAGWEEARARNFSSGMKEDQIGVSLSVTFAPKPPDQFGPMEGAQRDLFFLGRELTHFSEVANRTEQRLKTGELLDSTALQQAEKRAVSAIQAADSSLFSSGGQQAETKKITDRSEKVARTSLELPPQVATYERLVELHERGHDQDFLREANKVKEQFGGGVRKELELRGAFSEAALAKTAEAQREASRKIQEVRDAQYPALKDGQVAFGQALGEASKVCQTLKREHFSSWVLSLFGPNKKLVEAVKDQVRTEMSRLGKTAVDGVLSGSGGALTRSNLAQKVQGTSEIKDLAKAAQLDLKSLPLEAHLQKAEALHQANKASLEKLESAASSLRQKLDAKADYEEAFQKEALKELVQESEAHSILVAENSQKRYLPFGAEGLRVGFCLAKDAGILSEKSADIGRAWTSLGEKYLLADPKKSWVENYMRPLQKNMSGVNAISSSLSFFLGMVGLIATVDSAFGRVLSKDIRAKLDLGIKVVSTAEEGIQFSATSWDLLKRAWTGDFLGIDPVLSAYNLFAFPLTGFDWYRQSHRESAEFISESRATYILDDSLGVWGYAKGLVSLAVNNLDRAMEIAAAASAKAGPAVAVASNPAVLASVAAGSGYFYWNHRLWSCKRAAKIDNAYLSLSRGNFQDATNRLNKFQSEYSGDPASPILSRHIHFMKVIGREALIDNSFSKESKAKIMSGALTIFSSSQESLQARLQECGGGSVARIFSKELIKTTDGAKYHQP